VDYPIPVLRIAFREQSFFDFNSSDLRPEAAPSLQLIADLIRGDGGQSFVLVVGHTDNIGTFEYNELLSSRRAVGAAKLLQSSGIPIKRVHTAAMGRRQHLAKNDTAEGRAINRRVEFLISVSYEANLAVLPTLPTQSEDTPTASAPVPAQSDRVDIHDIEGNVTGRITIRPPRRIELRQF
jgi:hypothetical protein